jgi:response regulator RpfG family c-di-GMP phosphodiesterase
MNAPLPLNESERLRALHEYHIMDTPPEPSFDHLTRLAARHFNVPVALVTFMDEERQWFKSCVGTDLRENSRDLSFCSYTLLSDQVMVVPNATTDPRFRDNPMVTGPTGVRAYAGAPLRTADGLNLGSFCIIDTRPRRFNSAQKKMLEDLSTIAVDELELRQRANSYRDREHAKTVDLAKSQIEILQRLARAAEYRDDDTGQHTQRVARVSAQVAHAMGLPRKQVALIRQAAPLHDVGKIAISDLLLLKPGKLTDEEFATMKTHAPIGAALLSDGRSEVVQMAERIAGSHHERFDGNGYPARLEGEQIPLEGRILAVADVFDALTHERPYKKAWSVDAAVAEIKSQSGKHFDPKVVEAFLTLKHRDLI